MNTNDDSMGYRLDLLARFVRLVEEMPKLFVAAELVDILDSDGVLGSLQAMHECGIARLPWAPMLAEYDSERGREFVVLSERRVMQSLMEEGPYHPFRANMMTLVEGEYLVISPLVHYLCTTDDVPPENRLAGRRDALAGFGTHCVSYRASYALDSPALWSYAQRQHESETKITTGALFAALLLMNTRGVVKEVVEPTRLNAARARSGKSGIPTHTVIRVGHIYRRDGTAIRVEGGHKSPIMHLRRGHTRSVPFGPRRDLPVAERPHRLVYVEPMLVNYDPDETLRPASVVARL